MKLTIRRAVWTLALCAALLTPAWHTGRAGEKQPSKVADIVERLVLDAERFPADSLSALSSELLHVKPSGEVELSFHAVDPIGPDEEADLEALGATVSARLQAGILELPPVGLLQVWIPYDKIADAAALPWVAAVTPPGYPDVNPHPLNPTVSEGVPLHNADVVQTQGVTGAGVTVGVASVGAANVAQSQAQNELPAVTVFNTFTGSSANDEGTAMLEIIHDMAPGAVLMYDDGAGTGGVAHVNALNNLATNGANVIAEDLAFDAQPAFQQGLIATTREAVAGLGISVHSSSGNRGQNHAARVAAVGTGNGPDGFAGPFVNCGGFNPTNAAAIAPGGDTTFDVRISRGGARFTLQWSEPRATFPTAGQGGFTNLDLYAMTGSCTAPAASVGNPCGANSDCDVVGGDGACPNPASTCLVQSTGLQLNGLGDTIEQIVVPTPGRCTAPAASVGNACGVNSNCDVVTGDGVCNNPAVKIVVNVAGTSTAVAAPTLDLRWRGTAAQLDNPTRAGSIDPDKNYTGVAFSIGAVNTAGNLSGFSSAGPVNLLLTTMCPGGGAGPCVGVAGPAAQNFQGLDFVGANGVSVSGVGGFGGGTCPAVNPGDCSFSGTSASAPHTAACDALVREIIGVAATPAQARARLAGTAIDMGPPGEDPTTGAGLLDCFEALGPPEAVCQNVMVPTDPGVCTAATASIDGGSFDPFDPGGAPSVSLSQSPAGPYPLGGTVVDLTATDNDGLSKTCSATVTVVDQEPPTIACPADTTIECDESTDPSNTGAATATDNCDANPAIGFADVITPGACPQEFTISRTWTATDDAGNVAACVQTIEVVDTTPPTLGVVLDPDVLWPPNHKFWTINATITVMDNCDDDPDVTLVSITSNEPDNSNGDGNTSNDIRDADVGTDDRVFRLRAERRGGGDGRIYTVTYDATDGCGNSTQTSEEVRVPHDQSGMVMALSGFTADGTELDPRATTWRVLIPSTTEFDALGLDVDRAYIGNFTGVQLPTRYQITDYDEDGLRDLVLLYDADRTRALQASSNRATPIGMHYRAADGTDYAIDDVFLLGPQLTEVPLTAEDNPIQTGLEEAQ